MKRIATVIVLAFVCATIAMAQTYPTVSIHDLQFVPQDSLLKCDTLGINAGLSGWTRQTSAYYTSHTGGVRDTVEIVGVVIVPPKIITFTGPGTPFPGPTWNGAGGYNIVLRDTDYTQMAWSSIFVRPATPADTLALFNNGYLGLNAGDIIRMRGYIDEFPSGNMASYTQLVPVTTNNTYPELIGHKDPPAPIPATAAMFMKGPYPAGKTMFSTGESLEGCYVELKDLRVSATIATSNSGTFSMQDTSGNEISILDASMWFTLRVHKNPASTYATPSIGQIVKSVRGYISTNSGQESARGYRINPCFPGDLILGDVFPGVSTHRRNPVALTHSDTAVVSIKAFQQFGGSPIKNVILKYSLNNGPWVAETMNGPAADSTWIARIIPQSAGTFVRYFCEATDTSGNLSRYASAGGGSTFSDTTQGFFFYTVLDRPLTIHDVQYTPYSNGMSGFLGAVVNLNGIVTGDTSNISLLSDGTTPCYMQNGNSPWNGIWFTGIDSLLSKVKVGDSVSVTGTVQEYLSGSAGSVGRVTRLGNVNQVTVLSSGNVVPTPILLSTNSFNVPNGSSTAEPYEGMLVRFNNVTVTDTAPTFADKTEFTVNDGSGPILVRSTDGKNKYSNLPGDTSYGKTLLLPGDRFTYIQGVIYFSFNAYKLVPRGSSDYGDLVSGVVKNGDVVPKRFALSQNYPNPFNPATKIEYDIPKTGMVTLKIYNLLGQEVATLVDGNQNPGHYVAHFDASRLSSGVYFYALRSTSGSLVKKMLLLK